MILSHQHRFVFIKGRKVAGTSVEIALSQICGPDDVIAPLMPIDELRRVGSPGAARNYLSDRAAERAYLHAIVHTPTSRLESMSQPKESIYNHMSFREVIKIYGPLQDYRLLFVERSPYAKLLSLANWERGKLCYAKGEPLPRHVDGLAATVRSLLSNGRFLRSARNIDLYLDERGQLRSEGWRLETLPAGLKSLADEIGVPVPALPHSKEGVGAGSIDPRTIFDAATLQRVNEAFADEFAAFGYPMIC